MPVDPKRVQAVFLAAADAADRAAVLDRECNGDRDLRRRVEALLAAHDDPGDLPGAPAAGATAAHAGPGEDVGSVIAGRYKLLECIGEGGMGSVWMAEQREPVKRLVAVKLIKPGMDTKQVLARFEAERQALALMDHPNIARVLDGGTTDAGRPYFVMELVKGVPLTDYCDDRQLTVLDRLALFVTICSAVQHAHQKGVIHRDLKPTNILVTEHDGKPVTKVIDFGLAKALHATNVLTEKTLHTSFGSVVGTPLYMAPEQVGINALDVDTRTDVYTLGVILYELLTGSTPIDRKRLNEALWDEVRRLIREEEPPRPSTRLSTSDTLPSIAARRHVEPAKLSRLVRGELDWIVMRALAKDRSRRYETANGFAMDVQRFLAGEPVLAVPPSAGYRVRKVLRRYRVPLAVAAAFAGLLVAGTAVSLWQAVRAGREAAVAARERDEKQQALTKAQEELETRQAVEKFFVESVFAAGRPAGQEGGLGRNVTLRQAIDAAEPKIAGAFESRPAVEVHIRNVLGGTYDLLGERVRALVQFERAYPLSVAAFGTDHRITLICLGNVAHGYQLVGRTRESVALFERLLPRMQTLLGPDDEITLSATNNLGHGYLQLGRAGDAVALYEQLVSTLTARNGARDRLGLLVKDNLARVYMAAGRKADGIRLHEQTVAEAKDALGPNNSQTLTARGNLAGAYFGARRNQAAIKLYEELLPVMKEVVGADNPNTLAGMNNLALAYLAVGRAGDAVALLEKSSAGLTAQLGSNFPDAVWMACHLAEAYLQAGRVPDAVRLYDQAIPAARAVFGMDHTHMLRAMAKAGAAYLAAGRATEAIRLLEPAVRGLATKLGPNNLLTVECRQTLTDAYFQAGRPADAVTLLTEFVTWERTRLKPDDPELANRLARVVTSLLAHRQYAAAEPMARECLAIREKARPDRWSAFDARSMLGGALLGQQKLAEAEPLLLAGYEGMKARETQLSAGGKVRLAAATDRLVELYTALGKPDEAARWRAERARYVREQAPPPRTAK